MRRDIEGRRAQARESEWFASLFRQHSDAIFRFCLRRTGDWHLAEDLRSRVFYEAWRRRREIDLVGREARPWLYGVAINVIRNQRRSARRGHAALQRLPALTTVADPGEEIAERVDAARWAHAARTLIDGLPTREREVVDLCLGNGLSYTAAAAELDVPVGTIRSRLSRARARLTSLGLTNPEPPAPRRTVNECTEVTFSRQPRR